MSRRIAGDLVDVQESPGWEHVQQFIMGLHSASRFVQDLLCCRKLAETLNWACCRWCCCSQETRDEMLRYACRVKSFKKLKSACSHHIHNVRSLVFMNQNVIFYLTEVALFRSSFSPRAPSSRVCHTVKVVQCMRRVKNVKQTNASSKTRHFLNTDIIQTFPILWYNSLP